MLDSIILSENTDLLRRVADKKLDAKEKSLLGQFMTPMPIARFMASLFTRKYSKEVKLLEPGAGIGSLIASFIEEFATSKLANEISVTAYEVNTMLADYLRDTLSECNIICEQNDITSSQTIYNKDFIKEAVSVLRNDLLSPIGDSYTHVIMNPPYKKINVGSDHRKLLSSIGIETSNLYTAFLALAIRLLKDEGEIVAIIPRSFCNGPYFKPFRQLLFSEMSLNRIHVFDSRNHAFKEGEVLQENIILHLSREIQRRKVLISSSKDADFISDPDELLSHSITEDMTIREVDFENVVRPDDPEQFIYITSSQLDQFIVDQISHVNNTLSDIGLDISTGPVVDFRLKEDLLDIYKKGAAPLLYAHHFPNNVLSWPQQSKKPNALSLSVEARKWVWKNSGYFVVTKRFSSKEEKKRIVASVYDSSLPGEFIAFENHLNVFHKNKSGVRKNLAYGLASYLNSSLVDRYFRLFNGHTQVNSTDLRSFKYPSIEILEAIGKQTAGRNLSQIEIDLMIEKEVFAMSEKTTINPLKAQNKINEALDIVKALGFPRAQQNERSALTLLAILHLKPEDNWTDIRNPLMGITPIMDFCKEQYGKNYAPNTRETFRRQTMHQFVEAAIALYNPDDPGRAVNSPKACYQISQEAFEVVKSYGTENWNKAIELFLEHQPSLVTKYAKERDMHMIPVMVAENKEYYLSAGSHSELIKSIISDFAPRYARGSEVIYIGDTGDKEGYFVPARLEQLGVTVNRHGKMPDVVLYYPEKDWLLLVEAVTSHGPVDGKRHGELSELFKKAKPGLVFVTAFPDRSTMSRYVGEISWETEVWVADSPSHLIHFNGERFLGPYQTK